MVEESKVAEIVPEVKPIDLVEKEVADRVKTQNAMKFGSQEESKSDVPEGEGKETETAEAESESSPDKKEAEKKAYSKEEVDALLNERIANMQKRIDKLTAQKYEAKKEVTEETTKERVYTEEELDAAERKAYEDPTALDYNLLKEVRKEREKNVKRELINMYQEEKRKEQQALIAQSRAVEEWQEVVSDYSPGKNNAEYPKDDDLNIQNQDGKLFKTAKALYESEDSKYKNVMGGMKLATADAFRQIMFKKAKFNSSKEKDQKILERELADAKSKSELSIGGVGKGEQKATSTGDSLDDYVNERKATQRKMMRME